MHIKVTNNAICHLRILGYCLNIASYITVEIASNTAKQLSTPNIHKVKNNMKHQKFLPGRVSSAVGYVAKARPYDPRVRDIGLPCSVRYPTVANTANPASILTLEFTIGTKILSNITGLLFRL